MQPFAFEFHHYWLDESMKQATFELSRLSALSDGVFAIALTLLVLDIRLPTTAELSGGVSFDERMNDQLPHILAWVLSFAILARLWIVQHALLVDGGKRSRAFMAWNFVFLGTVSALPFTTSLIAERHDHALSVVVFSLALSVGGVALGRMWNAERTFFQAKAGSDAAISSPRPSIVLILLIAVIACTVALFHPAAGAVAWFAFPSLAPLLKRLLSKT